ncbi:hypothetical protein HK23_00855 [Acetobacter malorum]|uniref:Uncharacterized protein n=1 Tax=Acetobacter malorum TaxID=178901 RepID=A0A1Y3GCR6_9PROT|nr:hypothetical protein HK23_00855 [Acetobacter malorum]
MRRHFLTNNTCLKTSTAFSLICLFNIIFITNNNNTINSFIRNRFFHEMIHIITFMEIILIKNNIDSIFYKFIS